MSRNMGDMKMLQGKKYVWMAALAGLGAMASSSAEAGGGCVHGGVPCGPHYQVVQKTVLVPQMVPETHMVSVTHYHSEVRQRTVTVQHRVPETRMITENFTVRVPQTQMRSQTYTVKRPVHDHVQQTFTVQVPYPEKRQSMRTVAQPVQVQETRTICRDHGYWDTVMHQVPCGGCGPHLCGGCGSCSACCPHYHTVAKQVWRPNLVTEQVPVMVWKTQLVQVPYEHVVTAYRPETRTRSVPVLRFVSETHTRQVPYLTFVAQTKTRTRPVTTYRVVAEQRVHNYTVQVPTVVQKPVTVMVCRMVPQTVTCHVPVPCVH